MENEMSSGYLRFMSLLRAEESGEETQFDDADLIHTEAVEAPEPIAAPVTAPVLTDAPCVIADKFCDRFGIPRGSKLTWTQFGIECAKANEREFKSTGVWPKPAKKKRRKVSK